MDDFRVSILENWTFFTSIRSSEPDPEKEEVQTGELLMKMLDFW
jgi:hypothetical protein